MKKAVRDWDPANYLTNEEDITSYLDSALDDGDLSVVAAAFGDIAKARRMPFVAEQPTGTRDAAVTGGPDGRDAADLSTPHPRHPRD